MDPQGAFYAFPSFDDVLGREIGGQPPDDHLELAEVILDKAKVAIVPGEAFGAPGLRPVLVRPRRRRPGEGIGRIADLLA